MKLSEGTHEFIIKRLCINGCNAYLTGGAVRDLFFGIVPNDYDIVTEATPEQLEKIFSDQKVQTVGKSFEVCLVNNIEVAGYRKDTYFGLSDKNCEIEPAETLEEDLGRRDFTINAMAFCPYTGDLIDPYNGMHDLENKTIRFVGHPENRIYEDPCRILRACRLLTKINGKFSRDTFEALSRHKDLIHYVAPERIRNEIFKALKIRNASSFFIAMDGIGILSYVFPELARAHENGGPYHEESIFDHCMLVGDAISTRCPLTKLTGYLHDVGKMRCRNEDGSFTGHEEVGAEIICNNLKDLKFSTYEINKISNLTNFHMRDLKSAKQKGIRKALNKFNEKKIYYLDWIRLKFADAAGNLSKENYSLTTRKDLIEKFEEEMFSETPTFSIKHLAISGNDVMETLNIYPGPKVGSILNEIFEMIMENPENNNKEVLITWLQQYKS